MGLFKNEVGRPSNETIKKRRIIATVIIFAVVLAIGGCVFYTVNYFKGTQGSSKNISVNSNKIYKNISLKNNSGAIYNGKTKTNQGVKVVVGNLNNYQVELTTSNKASITIEVNYSKDIIKGKLSGVKRYYYQVQVASYDKNNKQISKSSKLDIKNVTTSQTITIGSSVAYLRVMFFDATKKHASISNVDDTITVTAYQSSNIEKTFPDKVFRKLVLDTYNETYRTSKTDLTDAELKKIQKLYYYDVNTLINSISGIEKLTGLYTLGLDAQPITQANLSKNTKLESLSITYGQLDKIDLTKNKNLKYLNLSNCKGGMCPVYNYKNRIKTINLNNNTKLEIVLIADNGLTSIDLRKNTKLKDLELQYNSLTKIDLSKNKLLEKALLFKNKLTSLDVSKNTKLKTLEVLNSNNIKKSNIKVGNNKNIKIS